MIIIVIEFKRLKQSKQRNIFSSGESNPVVGSAHKQWPPPQSEGNIFSRNKINCCGEEDEGDEGEEAEEAGVLSYITILNSK